jgi:hypothetical protein
MNTEFETIKTTTRVKPPMPGTKRKIRSEPVSEPANEPMQMPQKVGRGRPRKIKEPATPKVVRVRNEAYYTNDNFDRKLYAEANKERIHALSCEMMHCECTMWIRRDKFRIHQESSPKHVKMLKFTAALKK